MNEIETDSDELKPFLEIIHNSVNKFSALIKEISVVARIENQALKAELVDLNETLDNIQWSLDPNCVVLILPNSSDSKLEYRKRVT